MRSMQSSEKLERASELRYSWPVELKRGFTDFPNKGAFYKPHAFLMLGIGIAGGVAVMLLLSFNTASEITLLGGLVALGVIIPLVLFRGLYDVLLFLAVAMLSVNFVGIDPTDILIPMVLVVGSLRGRFCIKNTNVPILFHLSLGVFLLFYFLSILLGDPDWNYVGNFVARFPIVYLLGLSIRSPKDMRLIFAALLTGTLATGILGLSYQFDTSSQVGTLSQFATLSQGPPIFSEILFLSSDWRFRGLAGDPNFNAIYSIVTALWLLDEIVFPKLWKGYSLIKLLLLSAVLLQIVMSLSRGAWGNFGVALIVYALLGIRKQRVRRLIFGYLGIAIMVILSLWIASEVYPTYRDIITARFEPAGADFDRFRYARKGLDVAADEIFGYGPGKQEWLVSPNPPMGSHNLFVQTVVDNGWVCFVALILVVAFGIAGLAGKIISGTEDIFGLSSRVCLASLLGLIVDALTLDLLYSRILWFILGLVWVTAWSGKLMKRSTGGASQTF